MFQSICYSKSPFTTLRSISLFTLISACGCKPSSTEVYKAEEPIPSTAQKPQSSEPAQGKVVEGETFFTALPDGEAKTKGILVITPKPGFKVNADFPHRATYQTGSGEVTAQVSNTEKKLEFSSGENPLASGPVKVKADFSLCDDKSCQLYHPTYEW